MKVTSSEVGIEIAVTSVARTESRNTKITSTAKASPSRPSVTSVSIDWVMNGAWSVTTSSFDPSGMSVLSSGSSSATASDTSTVLAAGRLVTEIVRASSPLTRETVVLGEGSSSTSATSARVMSLVGSSRSGLRAILPRSAASLTRLPACTVSVLSPSVS